MSSTSRISTYHDIFEWNDKLEDKRSLGGNLVFDCGGLEIYGRATGD